METLARTLGKCRGGISGAGGCASSQCRALCRSGAITGRITGLLRSAGDSSEVGSRGVTGKEAVGEREEHWKNFHED